MRAGRSVDTIDEAAVGQLLDHDYTSRVCLTGPVRPQRRTSNLPQLDIVGLGSYFELQGAHTLVVQLRKRLLSLQKGFVHHPEFSRGLQLLRLVAAPGLGKVNVAIGVWYVLSSISCDTVSLVAVCVEMLSCILHKVPC